MVAKSYQGYIQQGEPFNSKGKLYVNMLNPTNGKVKTCRWYSEKEYAKIYPGEVEIAVPASTDPYSKTQKEALGFTNGYITIFKGDTYANIEWYRNSSARFAKSWGWYFISTEEVPEDVPNEPIKLMWEDIGNENGTLKNDTEVRNAVEALIYEPSVSEYQGHIGERIEITVKVNGLYRSESNFGSMYNMHIMNDENGNEFVWTTTSKCWPIGEVKTIRGTVKEFRTYKGTKQTVLTRCVER